MTTIPTTMQPANTLQTLTPEDVEQAREMLKVALKSNNTTPARMRAALESGWSRARWGGVPTAWPAATSEREADALAVAHLLLRYVRTFALELESVSTASAKSILVELLAA